MNKKLIQKMLYTSLYISCMSLLLYFKNYILFSIIDLFFMHLINIMELNVDNRFLKSIIAARAWDHILSTLVLIA